MVINTTVTVMEEECDVTHECRNIPQHSLQLNQYLLCMT